MPRQIRLAYLLLLLCFFFLCYCCPLLASYTLYRIIAEGVPESQTRAFNKVAREKGVGIIGPATVGGIKVGPQQNVWRTG